MKAVSLLVLFCIVAFSCSQDESKVVKTGNISFSPLPKVKAGANGRVADTAPPAAVLLTIKDSNGNAVYESKKLSLFTFGQSYTSEGLKLNIGSYTLTQCIVLDAADNAIYATPLQNSDMAKYVNAPLPISFTVSDGNTTSVVPEVLAITSNDQPPSFGYTSFGFQIVGISAAYAFQLSLQPGSIIDSAVLILRNDVNKRAIYPLSISQNTAKAMVTDILSGKYKIEVWAFDKKTTKNLQWQSSSNSHSVKDAFKWKSNITLPAKDSTITIPPAINSAPWTRYYYNDITFSAGAAWVFYKQAKDDTFLEIDLSDNLNPSSIYVDDDIYWTKADASNYHDQGIQTWSCCSTPGTPCQFQITGGDYYEFVRNQSNFPTDEVYCHNSSIYIEAGQSYTSSFAVCNPYP